MAFRTNLFAIISPSFGVSNMTSVFLDIESRISQFVTFMIFFMDAPIELWRFHYGIRSILRSSHHQIGVFSWAIIKLVNVIVDEPLILTSHSLSHILFKKEYVVIISLITYDRHMVLLFYQCGLSPYRMDVHLHRHSFWQSVRLFVVCLYVVIISLITYDRHMVLLFYQCGLSP
eukprot:1038802_1